MQKGAAQALVAAVHVVGKISSVEVSYLPRFKVRNDFLVGVLHSLRFFFSQGAKEVALLVKATRTF